ncbi:MAG: hypothetical protein AB7S26_26015 [Sandaracinaceae bacterium]
MKHAVFLVLLLVGCKSGPVPCTTNADCAAQADAPSCDMGSSTCMPRCTGDDVGRFACVDGDRVYCASDMSLPCTACPSVCQAGQFCSRDTVACAPLRAAGEACTQGFECANGRCTMGGFCSVDQGAACTEANCDGFCATESGGGTVCLRRCPSSACDDSTGAQACITFDVGAYCVPTCASCFGTCSLGSCDAACSPDFCIDFCAPPELNPEVFCS